MKKTLILATVCGLLASLASPAFASDSPGTYIDAQGITKLNPLTAKESSTTFVIAERADMVKERPGIAFTAKSTGSSTFLRTKGDYLLTTYDSGPAKPGIITASHDYDIGTVGLDLKTTPITSASASGTSTFGGVEITLKI